jgi:hypothetical protein
MRLPLATFCLLTLSLQPAFATPTRHTTHRAPVKRKQVTHHHPAKTTFSANKPIKDNTATPFAHTAIKTLAMPLPITDEPLKGEVTQKVESVEPVTNAAKSHWSLLSRLGIHRAKLSIPLAKQSWVTRLSNQEAAQLGFMIAQTVHELAPNDKALYLLPSPKDSTLETSIKYKLTLLGHSIAKQEEESFTIRYRVSRFHNSVLVSIKTPVQQTARLYQRGPSGAFIANSPVSSLQEP